MPGIAGDWQALADNVRSERTRRGLSQVDLASTAGVGSKTVERIESGKGLRRLPNTMPKIEAALGWEPGTARRIVYDGHRPAAPEPQAPSRPVLLNDDEREIWEIGERRGWPEDERWEYIKIYRDRRSRGERRRA